MRDCLIRNRMGSDRWLAFIDSHSSSKERSMNGAQFHLPWVGNPDGRLTRSEKSIAPQGRVCCVRLGELAPARAGITSWQVGGRIVGRDFIPRGRQRRWETRKIASGVMQVRV
jgi:hypothetical protein